MSMSRLYVLALVCALMVLGGCGGQSDDDGLLASPSPSPTEPASSAPTEPSEPQPPTSEPGTLVGIPEQGVEAGCWLLKGFLLLGGDEDLISSGQEIRVTGQVAKDVVTTCQQGIPYRVDSATPTDS